MKLIISFFKKESLQFNKNYYILNFNKFFNRLFEFSYIAAKF